MLSALAALCAMILERQFHWHMRSVGLAVGATFLVTLPMRQLYDLVEARLGTRAGIRFCIGAAVLGTLKNINNLSFANLQHRRAGPEQRLYSGLKSN